MLQIDAKARKAFVGPRFRSNAKESRFAARPSSRVHESSFLGDFGSLQAMHRVRLGASFRPDFYFRARRKRF
jgi:hypothetical protein